jgi:hypothetical protein
MGAMRQPGMSDRARTFVAPLVVLSVVLVALVVAIAVVLVVRDDERTDASAGSRVDPCVVGVWQVTAHTEDVVLPSVGAVAFKGEGAGPSVRLNADGSGVTDYGAATRYSGTAAGQAVRLDVRGTVRYRYTAAGGTFAIREPTQDAEGTIFLDGARRGEVPFTASTDPATYECSGDRMTQGTDWFETTLSRRTG